mmetsp:Transcript_2543/g.6886  ORF Transcript_2543/g.6886 Transcript_2543/m.6886 type:complete len:349 (+) Transcript_2543:525-1571(+)
MQGGGRLLPDPLQDRTRPRGGVDRGKQQQQRQRGIDGGGTLLGPAGHAPPAEPVGADLGPGRDLDDAARVRPVVLPESAHHADGRDAQGNHRRPVGKRRRRRRERRPAIVVVVVVTAPGLEAQAGAPQVDSVLSGDRVAGAQDQAPHERHDPLPRSPRRRSAAPRLRDGFREPADDVPDLPGLVPGGTVLRGPERGADPRTAPAGRSVVGRRALRVRLEASGRHEIRRGASRGKPAPVSVEAHGVGGRTEAPPQADDDADAANAATRVGVGVPTAAATVLVLVDRVRGGGHLLHSFRRRPERAGKPLHPVLLDPIALRDAPGSSGADPRRGPAAPQQLPAPPRNGLSG